MRRAVLAFCVAVAIASSAQTLTTLYSFCSQDNYNCADGAFPSGLVQATDGNFYGTTFGGGTKCGYPGCGTVFKMTSEGMLTTLASFNGDDGWGPAATVVEATDGNFYGTTRLWWFTG